VAPGNLRRASDPACVSPLGDRPLPPCQSTLAVSARRGGALPPRTGAARHGPRRRVALDPPEKGRSHRIDRDDRPDQGAGQKPWLLAAAGMAASGIDDRSMRRRDRLLVRGLALSSVARAQSGPERRLAAHLPETGNAPGRHPRERLCERPAAVGTMGNHRGGVARQKEPIQAALAACASLFYTT